MKKFAVIAALMISQAFCSEFNGENSIPSFSANSYIANIASGMNQIITATVDPLLDKNNLKTVFSNIDNTNNNQVSNLYSEMLAISAQEALNNMPHGFQIPDEAIIPMAKNNAAKKFIASEWYRGTIISPIIAQLQIEITEFEGSDNEQKANQYILILSTVNVPKVLEELYSANA